MLAYNNIIRLCYVSVSLNQVVLRNITRQCCVMLCHVVALPYVAGMSNTPCSQSVLLSDHVPQETLDKTYVYTGPTGRLSNEYIRLSNGTFVELSEGEQGTLYGLLVAYSVLFVIGCYIT